MTTPIRVLYVDDSPLDRQLVRDVLEREHTGVILTEANSKRQFEKRLDEGGYDVVLSDFNILGFEGLQVIEAVRAKAPDIPVVIVTGTGSEEIAVEAMKKGAADYVIKSPSHLKRLPLTIETALEKKRLEKQHEQDERLLRASEERFRLLYEHAPVGYQSLDEDGLFLEVNQAWVDLLGYSRDEVIGKWFGHLVAPAWEERFETNFPCFKAAGEIHGVQFEMVRKDGSTITVEFEGRIGYDREGNFKQTHCVLRDVTELRRAQEALRESEETFRSLFENSFDAILLTAPDGRVFKANPQVCRMFGCTEEEIIEAGRDRLVDTTDPRLPVLLEQRRQTGSARGELNFKRKDGTIFSAEVSSFIFTDSKGQQKTSMSILDLSVRQKAERSLRESEEKYRDLYENSPDMFISMDADSGRIVQCNETCAQVTGYNKEELLGRHILDMYHPDCRAQAESYLQIFRKTGELVNAELRVVSKDGSILDVILSSKAVTDDQGKILYSRSSWRDITDRKRADQQLRASEEKLKSIFRAAPVGIGVVVDRVIKEANDYFCEMVGYNREELLDQNSRIVYASDEDFEWVGAEKYRQISEKGKGTVETRWRRKDGQVIDVLLSSSPTDPADPLLGVTFTALDITDRRRGEELLRESEERHRTLVEHLPQRIFLKDRNSIYVSCNANYAADLGIAPEQIVGKDDFDFYPAELANKYRLDDQACMAAGTVKDLEDLYELAGQERWAHTIKVPYRDGQGRVIGVLGIFEDITERRQAEQTLRESQERYRKLFDESKDGVYITTLEGQLIEANQAYCEIVGYASDEIVGQDVRITYANASDRDHFVGSITKTGFLKDYPLTLNRKDGKEIHCLLTSSVRRAESGAIIGYQGILRDVTEQRSLQNQLLQAQKMEAIGTLAGGVAHDFNNVLQVALGYSELILGDEELPQRYQADLGKIRESAKRGADLVQRLLTFSRKVEVKTQPVSLNRRVREMKKMIERTIPKMILIQLVLAEDLATINADPTQIDQVLMNLSVNARDAMPEEGKLIIETANIFLDEEYARTHFDAKPGRHVLLMVTDTGSGMDKDTVEHIFEPFYTTKGVGEGTGLGLAMVHGIVQQHGGHIRCYSEPGQGTTFKIYFPALVADEAQEGKDAREMPRGGSETILLVDDEEIIRDLGSRILAKAGYRVLSASNGKDALKLYQQRRDEISLVIMDLIMPEMGGKQCLEGLLSLDPKVKALIASGFAIDGPTRETIEAGAKGFVGKPFNMKQLLGTVRKVLDEP